MRCKYNRRPLLTGSVIDEQLRPGVHVLGGGARPVEPRRARPGSRRRVPVQSRAVVCGLLVLARRERKHRIEIVSLFLVGRRRGHGWTFCNVALLCRVREARKCLAGSPCARSR
jgi:hypothetical protein